MAEPLTKPGGPVVTSERTLRAMIAIRRDKLMPQMFDQLVISQCCFEVLSDVLPEAPDWLAVLEDQPQQALPERVASANKLDAAAMRLGLAIGASEIFLEGSIKEKAKLSFIKSQGAVSILVSAHRQGLLTAVQPMLKALKALGFEDVLPPPDLLEALYKALDDLR